MNYASQICCRPKTSASKTELFRKLARDTKVRSQSNQAYLNMHALFAYLNQQTLCLLYKSILV